MTDTHEDDEPRSVLAMPLVRTHRRLRAVEAERDELSLRLASAEKECAELRALLMETRR